MSRRPSQTFMCLWCLDARHLIGDGDGTGAYLTNGCLDGLLVNLFGVSGDIDRTRGLLANKGHEKVSSKGLFETF